MRFPLLSKVVAIGLVVLLLMSVLMRIDGLVSERRWRQAQATTGVEQSLAGAQTLVGPLLERVCVEERDAPPAEGREPRKAPERRSYTLGAAPATLQVAGDVRAEPRYRGLFKVNGYSGKLVLDAQWPSLAALQPPPDMPGVRVRCGPVRVLLSVSDARGLRAAQLLLDGTATAVRAGAGQQRHVTGLHAEIDNARAAQADRPLAVRATLDLLGTGRLGLVPAAGETAWSLRSDWPHPSFGGRFLPAAREVTEQGFSARWAVSALASAAGRDVFREVPACPATVGGEEPDTAVAPTDRACLDTMGVAFVDPVNPYVLTDRATKYALLFIVLTFGCVALTEVLAQRRVHPVQYTLVGLALALFFLLLLSLSEHVAFGAAYAAASAACVGLLGVYARHMLGSRRAGAAFGAGVALLYGALWTLLRLEQTALVIGSTLLFAVLAVVMWLTRRVDWYELFERLRQPAARSHAASP